MSSLGARLRGVVGIALAIALLLGLGGLTFASERRAVSNSENVHRSDRLQLQDTLSGLTKQYLLLTFGELDTLASAGGWQLRPDSVSDHERLASYVSSSPLISAGAAVVGLTGSPLNESTRPGVALPPPSDPGYTPMRTALLAGQPGLSDLMVTSNQPLLAFGLPIMAHGHPAAVLVGYVDPRTWPLQQYVSRLQLGADAQPFILDNAGRAVAARNVALIGRRVPGLPSLANTAAAHLVRYRGNGQSYIATHSAIGVSGWQSVNTQQASAFNGSIDRRQTQTELALLALLLVMGIIAIAALYSRHRRLTTAARDALFDPLTGLAQRQLITLRLESALARCARTNSQLAVIYGDLDGFKSVNDTHGHRRGDALLVEVGRRLRAAAREEDLVARIGGDEFVLVVEGVNGLDDLATLTTRITDRLADPVRLDRGDVHIGISLGGILARAGSPDVILEAADTAMYDAKRNHRGTVIRELGVLDQLPQDYTVTT